MEEQTYVFDFSMNGKITVHEKYGVDFAREVARSALYKILLDPEIQKRELGESGVVALRPVLIEEQIG